MNSKSILLANCLVFLACVGLTQPPEMEVPPGPPPAPAPAPLPAPASVAEDVSRGDIVVFKKGTELRDVKVVRQSAMFVEIEYLPGEPPLQIPTTQVEEVIYAERYDRSVRPDAEGLPLGPDIIPGEEVSADFHAQLMTPLSDESLVYDQADYLDVIRQLSDQVGVEVSVDENLAALDAEARLFSRMLPEGVTLLDFLRIDLADIAPEVRVIVHYDRLALQKRIEPPADAPLPDGPPPADAPIAPDLPPPDAPIAPGLPPATTPESPVIE